MLVAVFDSLGFLRQIKTVSQARYNHVPITLQQAYDIINTPMYDREIPQLIQDEILVYRLAKKSEKTRYSSKGFEYSLTNKGYYSTLFQGAKIL